MKFRTTVKILKGRSGLSLKWYYVNKARQKINGKKGWICFPMTQEQFRIINNLE